MFDLNGAPKPPIRIFTMPDLPATQLKHSKSQETFCTSSHGLQVEPEGSQFAGVTKSRLIHYASDGDLCTVQMTSQGSLRDVAEELKSFSRSVAALALTSVDKARPAVRAAYPETSLKEVENSMDRRASITQEASGPNFPQSGLSMRPTSNSASSVTRSFSGLQLPGISNSRNRNAAVSGKDTAFVADESGKTKVQNSSQSHIGASPPDKIKNPHSLRPPLEPVH